MYKVQQNTKTKRMGNYRCGNLKGNPQLVLPLVCLIKKKVELIKIVSCRDGLLLIRE